MADFKQIADRYIEMWNETDAGARRAIVEELWAVEGRYIDPVAAVAGHDDIDATVAAVQQQFPGMSFSLSGRVDAHHDQARFSWELGPSEAESLIVGFDVAQLDDDGRLALVLGFHDKVAL